MSKKRLGFFTRLLDDVSAGERYRLAEEQIFHAEALGFDSAWVAQHHFNAQEGGLPSPLVFLAHAAARTSRIQLGTAILTLPLEQPIRVAEDAVVLDLLSGGRFEFGLGSGGTNSSFPPFGFDPANRGAIYGAHFKTLVDALEGRALGEAGQRLYPEGVHLRKKFWQATFSAAGGTRAGEAGDGLLLSRSQPRTPEAPRAKLWDLQHPIVDAYLAALPPGVAPRLGGSRSVFVADTRSQAYDLAAEGIEKFHAFVLGNGGSVPSGSLTELLEIHDIHAGTADDVIGSLKADTVLDRVTDLIFQVHPVDPDHKFVLRSLELIAEKVAPALGWAPAEVAHAR